MIDPVELTAALIRCPSVTPAEGGALTLLEEVLTPLGFRCTRVSRGGIENLHARWGEASPVFAFAGHTDVVPPGAQEAWSADPFGGEERDGILYGRGAVDMKSGVAAFVAAAAELVARNPPPGSIALLVTGDEEGEALHGTRAILDWMAEHGEKIDFCIVGEPTSLARVGDQIKIGRRGSMTGTMTVTGRAGHTAYPDAALNPLPALARLCDRLSGTPLDMGSAHFEASTLALSTIDVGNTATNVIPRQGRAVFNIRFNDRHTSDELKVWAEEIVVAELADSGLGEAGLEVELSWQVSGESFYTPPGGVADVVSDAIRERMLEVPALSTGGGTSDARFIKDHCPVVELGLVGDTMHQADERVPVEDIRTLSVLYGDILRRFFGV